MAIFENEGCSSKPAQFQMKPKESDMKQKKKRKPLCFSLRKDGKSPLAEIERGLRERLLWESFHSQIRLTRGHKCKIITILTRGHNNLNKRAQVQKITEMSMFIFFAVFPAPIFIVVLSLHRSHDF